MWQALSASFSITQKLDYVIETALYFYTFTTDIATLLLKFLTALLLLYYFGWRTASAFYLGANIFGSGVIFYYFFKFLFFFLQHCVADSIYTSGLILAVFLLHELNLISVPRILAYCTRKVVAFLHRSCDVTGDGKFDYQDVAVLGGRVEKKLDFYHNGGGKEKQKERYQMHREEITRKRKEWYHTGGGKEIVAKKARAKREKEAAERGKGVPLKRRR
eukprot:g14280.t1